MVKYSIIIPTFNNPDELENCLKSLEMQTFKDFEVLVIDDGSSLDYSKVISKKRKIDIKYFRISNSGGPAKPRNLGIEKSKGRYICFLDSDDEWKTSYLDTINNISNNYNFISTGATIRLDTKSNDIIPKLKPPFAEKILLNGNPIFTSSVCVEKKLLTENSLSFNEDPMLSGVEDLELWYRILVLKEAKFCLVNTPLIFYKMESTSLSRNDYKNYIQKHEKLFQLFREQVKLNDSSYFNHLNYLVSIILLKQKKINESLKRIFQINPFTRNGVYLIVRYFVRFFLKGTN